TAAVLWLMPSTRRGMSLAWKWERRTFYGELLPKAMFVPDSGAWLYLRRHLSRARTRPVATPLQSSSPARSALTLPACVLLTALVLHGCAVTENTPTAAA